MHLSPELEWAQFLVIMVVGLMLLYDCVVARKHARKLEGLIGPDEDLDEELEGMDDYDEESDEDEEPLYRSDLRYDTSGHNLRFAQEQGQANLASSETFLGSMEAPVYYPTLSEDRGSRRSKYTKRFRKGYRDQLTKRKDEKIDSKWLAEWERKREAEKAAAEGFQDGLEEQLEQQLR